MGVPALFRWLSRKYPKVVSSVIEEDQPAPPPGPDGVHPPVRFDMSKRNPNGETDCLYLDMNGIVHPCTHPEGKPAPETEEDMMVAVFEYTERVVNMIRPRKLLFMAIDGVAPRAKMNQQRSRRFRSAQEAKVKEEVRQEAILEWEARGRPMGDAVKSEKAWDQNAITPGTPFMDLLAASLRYWVAKKMNSSPGWQNIQVIISDASVPGEGEHKIMDFIRRQRSQPSHEPNTRHVIYGLDADLIMLSLATHEPYFKVLREDVFAQGNKPRGCHRCGQPGHHSAMCTNPPKAPDPEPGANLEKKPFIFLDVSVLREYLEIELDVPNMPFAFDFERAIDDWVFLIFFVGNDFLPHLPSLEIREGAIDTLMTIWRAHLAQMGGYLTEHGTVRMERAQFILDGLAAREDGIFAKRKEAEERQDANEKRRRIGNNGGGNPLMNEGRPALPPKPSTDNDLPSRTDYVPVQGRPNSAMSSRPSTPLPSQQDAFKPGDNKPMDKAAVRAANLSAAELLRQEIGQSTSPAAKSDQSTEAVSASVTASAPDGIPGLNGPTDDSIPGFGIATTEEATDTTSPRGIKRKADEADVPATRTDAEATDPPLVIEEEDDASSSDIEEGISVLNATVTQTPAPLKMLGDNMVEQEDTVKLWEPGYRERYYRQKFGVELNDVEFRRSIVKSYIEGLCWVLAYYYQGCPSWQWYYPHHFAPFAADFDDLATLNIKFDLGSPFRPYEQLMGVFPAASRQHIPAPFHKLMIEPTSPVIDFYPEDFHVDMNGKKMLWQGVALLPFIDPQRLLAAMAVEYPQLTEEEVKRNSLGKDALFVHEDHPLYAYLGGLYGAKTSEPIPLDIKRSHRIAGAALADPECIPGSTYFSPLNLEDQNDIDNDRSMSAFYFFPAQLTPHKSILLPGTKIERKALNNYDKDVIRRGGMPPDVRHHDHSGFHGSRREIDGTGVRRESDRGGRNYNAPNGRPDYDRPSSAYNSPRASDGYNRPPDQHQRNGFAPSSYPPANGPRPSYSNGPSSSTTYGGYGNGPPPAQPIVGRSSYGGYGGQYAPPPQQQPQGYRPPAQYAGYGQQPMPAPTHSRYAAAPVPMNLPAVPPSLAGYGGYGRAGPPPTNQAAVAFQNAQALLRSLPAHLQGQQQDPYRR